jgi:hypothetical protein
MRATTKESPPNCMRLEQRATARPLRNLPREAYSLESRHGRPVKVGTAGSAVRLPPESCGVADARIRSIDLKRHFRLWQESSAPQNGAPFVIRSVASPDTDCDSDSKAEPSPLRLPQRTG